MSLAMRKTAFALSLSLPAVFPALAQEAPPRVLFCSGPCFAVDAAGARTAVSKGARLSPGQRLETGPGAYLQVKVGRAGLGLAENTRLHFTPGAITLDQGRLRAVTGTSPLLPAVANMPAIRTPDGVLALKSGDIEIKKTVEPGTLVKLNAGDAIVRSGLGELPLPKEAVQNLQAGRPSAAPAVASRQLVLAPIRSAPEAQRPGATTPPTTPIRPLPPVALVPRPPAIQPPPLPPIRDPDGFPNRKLQVLDGTSRTLPEILKVARGNVIMTTGVAQPTTEQRLTQLLPPRTTPSQVIQPTASFSQPQTGVFVPSTPQTRPTISLVPTRVR